MRKAVDLSLVLPCYNEEGIFEDSVKRIIGTLKRSGYRFEIIFVDDKSSDNTVHLIRKACKKYSECRALYHNINTGRGKAVADGIIAAGGACAGYIDIDCEVSPIYIPELADLVIRGKADVVIGDRIYRTTVSAIVREVLSRGYKWLSDKMLATGGLDTESGYKFFNRKKILPVVGQTKHPHWFWDTEIIVRAKRAGLRIKEVPVLFIRRTDKVSSVHILRDSADYIQSLWNFSRELTKEKKQHEST